MHDYHDHAADERADQRRDAMADEYDNDPCHIDGVCSGCGEHVRSVTIDVGLGVVEYWGFVSRHKELVEASPCCLEEVVDDGEEF